MHKVLQSMIRHRIAIAAAGFLILFLGMNAVFFLVSSDELTAETQASHAGVSVIVRGGPTVNAIMTSPVMLFTVLIVTILIIMWLIFTVVVRVHRRKRTVKEIGTRTKESGTFLHRAGTNNK
jgi:uncharacterized membrane protein